MGTLRRTANTMVTAMCTFIDSKNVKDLMQMLHLNKALDQLDKINNVCWLGHELRRMIMSL